MILSFEDSVSGQTPQAPLQATRAHPGARTQENETELVQDLNAMTKDSIAMATVLQLHLPGSVSLLLPGLRPRRAEHRVHAFTLP